MRPLINHTVKPSNAALGMTFLCAAILAGVVFLASLFGIFTRPSGLLALFWPANAILLGLMVRHPRFATPVGWAAAFAAYVTADLIMHGPLVKTLWLTGANIAGVFIGSLLYRFVGADHRRLREPQSVIIMFVICTAAALASALVGGIAAGVALNEAYFSGFEFWLVTELVNFIVVLPVVLIAPPLSEWNELLTLGNRETISWERNALPVAALILSMFISSLIGGPGAFAFPVPALLWCATSFSLFPTALLTLVFSIWGMMVFSSAGTVPNTDPLCWVQSIRLGLGMIAMAPLSVASVTTTRNFLLQRLQDSVDHDFLTRTLARGTLMARGENIVSQDSNPDGSAVLVLDIDHFKAVNDRFGHAAGDRALVAFANVVASTLRKDDLFGRTGGEEFCVVLPKTSALSAQAVAERIRRAVERLEIDIGGREPLKITVSGGLAVRHGVSRLSFDDMLTRADMALYRAKAEGRNRIVSEAS
ncbi:diguanylate cyclase [Pararhizobium sp. PWRC1-1]|uniref:GGDEF domain-containing protein n=1 Tax=Pararhizobium sp. PWRC1-1 TaxID=2804566 RepID=UPI003CE8C123